MSEASILWTGNLEALGSDVMKCPQCQTDNPDPARVCVRCGVPLNPRCPSCQTELPAGSRFCLNCGRPVSAGDSSGDARPVASELDPLPEQVRAAAPLSGERRIVTVLFAGVVGGTVLAGQLGAETWPAIVKDAVERITPAIHRYGGTIARLVDDGVWAFFGVPVAHEDDALRAVRAAVDLLEAARQYAAEVRQDLGLEFTMHVSLNTGPVIVGSVADDWKYEYSAMGSTASLAARLRFAAPPMTAVLAASTCRLVAPVFDVLDLGLIEVEGGADPVRVYRLRGAKDEPGQARGPRGLQSPMVGRDAELSALLRLCEAVRAGLGRAALVVGEPGLGKTRLIAEWRARVEAEEHDPLPLWAEARGLSYRPGVAYHLLSDLLRSLVRIPGAAGEPEDGAALEALTTDLFGDEALDVYAYLGHLLLPKLEGEALERVQLLDPQALQAQYVTAMRRLLGALAAHRPLVLILEDLHWADPSSIEVLIRLLPLASAAPVLFCLVARPDRVAPGWKLVTAAREVMGDSLTDLTLLALSEGDSQQLVANLLESNVLPDGVCTLVLKNAEGNPFFVKEMVRVLIDRGAVVRQGGTWQVGAEVESVEVPDSLQGLLLARIDRLPDGAKHALRVAAVIGREFPVRVLQHVLEGRLRDHTEKRRPDTSAWLQPLAQLEAEGLLRVAQIEPELCYAFQSVLVHQAVCNSMLDSDRRWLHRAVGEALEMLYRDRLDSRELAPDLARHFDQAGDGPRALRYFGLAGEAALACFANREAEGHHRRALALSPSNPERLRLLLGLGEAVFRQSRFDEALQTWRQGLDLCRDLGDGECLPRLYARSARAAWYSDVAESLKLSREGLGAVEGAPESAELAGLLHEAARAHFFNGLPDQALLLCRQALEMAQRLEAVEVQADALATLGMLLDGQPQAALEVLTQAVELAESAGLIYQAARAHTNLAYSLYSFRADFRAAREHDQRAAELSRQRGSASGEILGLGNVVHLSLLLGDFEEAEATLAQLRRLQGGVDDPGTVAVHIQINEAGLLRYRGELGQAARLLRECRAKATQQGNLEDLVAANTDLANTLLEACILADGSIGAREAALAEAEVALVEAIATSDRAGWPTLQARCLLSTVRALQGQVAESRRVLAEMVEHAYPQPTSLDQMLLSWAQAMAATVEARWSEALAAFEAVVGISDALGLRWWRARALQAWAEAHVARGQPTDLERARALFREARTLFRELSSSFYVDLVERRSQALRERTYAWTLGQQRVARELAAAGVIQEGLLPAEKPRLADWELQVTLEPARETSGDFYDFIELPDGRLGLVLADVADKGAGAALYMAMSRTLIRTFAVEYPDQPERVLAATNARILADTNLTMFVTVFYGVLDPATGVLTYCNAGHNPPYLLNRREPGDVQALTRTGMALGVLEDEVWEQGAVQIVPGDALVIYTDGVTEAHNSQQAVFGEERLLWLARACRDCSIEDVHETMLNELHRFVGEAPQFDDITLMVLARL